MQEKEKAEFDINIIHEDNDILVMNKPAGIPMHGDGHSRNYTIADWICRHRKHIIGVGEEWTSCNGEKIHRPGIVHRLDKDTSGVIVIAKNQKTYTFLKDQFKNRKVVKEYRAIARGVFNRENMSGVINKKIGRSPRDFRKWSAQPGARGLLREAITEYRVLSQIGKGNDGYSYIKLFPKTGRTHQIRVHLKSLHRPIIGDNLYGFSKSHSDLCNIKRMMLHAYKLSFQHPCGKQVSYSSTLPKDFTHALQALGLNA